MAVWFSSSVVLFFLMVHLVKHGILKLMKSDSSLNPPTPHSFSSWVPHLSAQQDSAWTSPSPRAHNQPQGPSLVWPNLSHPLPPQLRPAPALAWTVIQSPCLPASLPQSFCLSCILASTSFQKAIWPPHKHMGIYTHTHTHTHPSTLQVCHCLSTPTVWKPKPLECPQCWALYLLGELFFHFPLEHSVIDGGFADPPLPSPLLKNHSVLCSYPLGACALLRRHRSSHATLPHCTVGLARTGPSYALLHPCPLAQGLSHHRYSINNCRVKFTQAGGSRVRIHIQVYPSPWSAFLTVLHCPPRDWRKLCPLPSWSMLSVLWRAVL